MTERYCASCRHLGRWDQCLYPTWQACESWESPGTETEMVAERYCSSCRHIRNSPASTGPLSRRCILRHIDRPTYYAPACPQWETPEGECYPQSPGMEMPMNAEHTCSNCGGPCMVSLPEAAGREREVLCLVTGSRRIMGMTDSCPDWQPRRSPGEEAKMITRSCATCGYCCPATVHTVPPRQEMWCLSDPGHCPVIDNPSETTCPSWAPRCEIDEE